MTVITGDLPKILAGHALWLRGDGGSTQETRGSTAMRGKQILYIDQYGQPIWARTVKELREKCGGGRVFKIYRDKQDGPEAEC